MSCFSAQKPREHSDRRRLAVRLLHQVTIRFLPFPMQAKRPRILQRLQPNQQKARQVSAPIRNGGRWSPNWRVINLFKNENGRDDEGLRLQNQRRKIAGSAGDRREGMQGLAGGTHRRWARHYERQRQQLAIPSF